MAERSKAEEVKALLAERNLSVAWAARQVGVTRQSLSNWLNEVYEPEDPRILDRVKEAILGTGGALVRDPQALYGTPAPTVAVPINTVGTAGTWTHAEPYGEIELPVQLVYNDYHAVLIDGTSMLPHIHPGDVAVFRTWHAPKIGYVNAFAKDGKLMVKQVEVDKGQMVLRSLNPSAEKIDAEGVRAVGYLVGLYRDDGADVLIRHNRGGLRFD